MNVYRIGKKLCPLCIDFKMRTFSTYSILPECGIGHIVRTPLWNRAEYANLICIQLEDRVVWWSESHAQLVDSCVPVGGATKSADKSVQ